MPTPNEFRQFYDAFRQEHPELLVHFIHPISAKVIRAFAAERALKSATLIEAKPYIETLIKEPKTPFTRYGCIISYKIQNSDPVIGWSCVSPKDVVRGFKFNKYLAFYKAVKTSNNHTVIVSPECDICFPENLPLDIQKQWINMYNQGYRRYYGKRNNNDKYINQS